MHAHLRVSFVCAGSIEVPSGVPVEYKYVIHRAGGHGIQWEDGIGNRMFTPEGVFVLRESTASVFHALVSNCKNVCKSYVRQTVQKAVQDWIVIRVKQNTVFLCSVCDHCANSVKMVKCKRVIHLVHT